MTLIDSPGMFLLFFILASVVGAAIGYLIARIRPAERTEPIPEPDPLTLAERNELERLRREASAREAEALTDDERQDLERLRRALDEERSDVAGEQLPALQAEIAELQASIVERDATIDGLRARVEAADDEREELTRLRAHCEVVDREVEERSEEIARLREVAARADLTEAERAELAKLRVDISALEMSEEDQAELVELRAMRERGELTSDERAELVRLRDLSNRGALASSEREELMSLRIRMVERNARIDALERALEERAETS